MDIETHILLVEDEPAIRASVRSYLNDLGYRVSEAADGAQALELFRCEPPDLVLCDLRLPRVDGLDVLSAITGEMPEVPVIVVSGVGTIEDSIQSLKRGAWDYISKPILDFGILETAILRALDRARLLKENREYQTHLERLNSRLTQAIEKLKEDEEAARVLQVGMLPDAEFIAGPYLFRQRIFTSHYLSGDFIDFFRVSDSETGFYMADISGHGAASAMVTAMLKMLFEKYRERLENDEEQTLRHPAKMLDRLNQDFCQLGIEKYLTIFYGIIDSADNSLRFCSGGQFPHPFLNDGEQLIPVTQHDKPVGLFEGQAFTEHRRELPARFVLFLASDGILELLKKDSAQRRVELLAEILRETDCDIETLVNKLAVDEQDELPDDISLLTLSRDWA